MTSDDMLDHLEKLIQLEVDATHAYDQAIETIDDPIIKDKLIGFLADHHRHIELLCAKVQDLGWPPPELTSGFRGFLRFGSAALHSLGGTKGALEAMVINEELASSRYQDASKLDWPGDIGSLIYSNLADEQRHLSFISAALSEIVAGTQETGDSPV